MIRVHILLFATLKDRAGAGSFDLDVFAATPTIADVRTALGERFPALVKALPTAVAARNEEFAFPHEVVSDGDTVAFFPPVSGGSGEPLFPVVIRLADGPYSLDELTAAITLPTTGAICLFSGTVRGESTTESGAAHTVRLEYEAYAPMAEAKMRQVADEIRARWPGVQGIAIVQRIGVLAIGQPTVLIACASAHRDGGCFEAARYGIDRLKAIVPVWKKEVRPDGSAWVEGEYQPTPDDRTI